MFYMRRALELARLGSGYTAPNPMVGCVVVHNGQIIGEGWHRNYGGPHAEVNAVASVQDKSLLPESRVYVTLEPCSHFGKTPPCADLLIESGVRDVVICNLDPNPLVAGRGVQKLLDAGIKVETGLLEQEGLEVNKRFFTSHRLKRPYITLKWAETADGFIAGPACEQIQISGALAKRFVHKLRAEEQAIMVGTRTALHDNPRLNTRHWSGRNPIRIVIDRQLTLPETINLYDGSQPTIVYNYKKQDEHENLHFAQLQENEPLLPQIMTDLYKRNVISVLVEGGTYLLESLLHENLWDEAFILKNTALTIGDGIKAPTMVHGNLIEQQTLGTDQLLHYRNQ
ncbi:bifunctional diaminohydroxyphosphoribosylaminopyrimidine deaminase/5-amino-6-(5-phosphoribosylamino)uracil reductase RibD [Pontibacter fetidus]|uniref:bifunctional diaminohydroxyphosphoribosylaminopyrimidine deaminase/5-amino-6-(5-phosphoribosylamino)uracil reductase RibD n=1 Tax=Pontibacter fetidus TaxID=2700082 RepID=UPI00293BA2F0|nr:bifunctional diaminohydroxyphosphoribosylaminopyrimidine deaminase/5-amino-6-(5-phosphoribosylamino)uracil reductase RibD [Pontibacter fetidus]